MVGSGAAGGMAAFQLATAGIKVLMLEAGRHARPPPGVPDDGVAVRVAAPRPPAPGPSRARRWPSTTSSTGPTANNPAFAKHKKVTSYAGNTFTRNWVVNEKEHPTTGTPVLLGAGPGAGRQDELLGPGALRYGPLQFQAASRDGFDVDWPISYEDVAPYYDKVDVLLGCSGTKEGLVQVPDGIFQRPS